MVIVKRCYLVYGTGDLRKGGGEDERRENRIRTVPVDTENAVNASLLQYN